MKRVLMFVILLVLTSIGASVNVVRGGGGYQFEVSYPAYEVKNIEVNDLLEDGTPIKKAFTSVEISGLHANGVAGAPKLLSEHFDIAVENDAVDVEYVILDADTLQLLNALFPKQIELPTSMAGQKPEYFAYDVASYGASAIAPVSVGSFHTFRKQRAATVTINPMQYDGSTNQLIIIKKMSVMLKMDAVRSLKTGRSNLFENVMRNKFKNLQGVDGRAVPAQKFRGTEDYLIIATSDYIDNPDLKRLIDYRSQQYNVEVVNASDVPQQTKDGFKSYIRGKMPTFCLLVGSYRDFPQHSHTYYNVTCKSVSYYVCSDGNTPDPDISLGLFFVSSATDIKNIVDKTLATEQNNDDNPKVFVGVGGNKQQMGQLDPDHCDRVVEQMYNDFFKPMDFDYVSSYSVQSGNTTCVNACNEGARVFNYNGHGFENGWQYGWGNSDVSSLTNDVYPFVLSCACLTGTFDKGCMAEKFAYGPKGAVAFIGAYQNSFGGQHGLDYGFCEALTDLKITRVGLAFVNGQNCWTSPTSTVLMPSDNGNMTMMQYQYHLFGDPATEVMTSPDPEPFVTVTAPNGGETVAIGESTVITWNSNSEDKVTIKLTGAAEETIASDVENSGSYEWDVPEDIAEGSYKIEITSGSLTDESDESFTIKKIKVSGNLVKFGDWYVSCDSLDVDPASKATLDTSKADEIAGVFKVGQTDNKDIWPWASLSCEPGNDLGGVTSFKITYKSDKAFIFTIDDPALSADGIQFGYKLPASSSFTNVVVTPDMFVQPDWISDAQKADLDLAAAKSVSFNPDDAYGKDAEICINNFQLYNFKGKQESIIENSILKAGSRFSVAGMTGKKLSLIVPQAGSYEVALYSLSGKVIASKKVVLNAGLSTINWEAEAFASQMAILSVKGMNQQLTTKQLIAK